MMVLPFQAGLAFKFSDGKFEKKLWPGVYYSL
jgi:hypothetical protein